MTQSHRFAGCPNASMRSPHDVLGVPEDADVRAVKNAFRRLAKVLHPDRNPHPRAGVRFRELV